MADMNFEIRIAPDAVLSPDDIAALLEVLSDYGAILLDEVATYLQQEEQEAFDTQGASIGQQWAPLSPRTVKEKARLGFPSQPLVRHGYLASAIAQQIILTGNTVSVGVDTNEVLYAAAQQHGSASQNRPARVFVAITPEQVQELQQRLAQFIADRAGVDPSAIEIVQT